MQDFDLGGQGGGVLGVSAYLSVSSVAVGDRAHAGPVALHLYALIRSLTAHLKYHF